ncbi:MAG: hypothetical protein ACXABO_12585 [Promethearchaeota archaeon]|jgi:uncharacterized protein YydD (DUF2326 family)
MTEYNKCQRICNRIQGVYNEFGLIFEGFIRSEYERSILFEFRRDKESYIHYPIKRIVVDENPSNFNEWQSRNNRLNSKLVINRIRRLLWTY